MAEPVIPIVQVFLYNAGSHPYFGPTSDQGATWFSVLANDAKYGTFPFQQGATTAGVADYIPKVEYIGRERMRTGQRSNGHELTIGLVLRPFILPMNIGGWTNLPTNAGVIDTLYANVAPPVQYLVQSYPGVDNNGNTTVSPWGAASNYSHPENPHFAFSMVPMATTPEYNELVGGVPYVQLSWGNLSWAIRFFHNGNPVLLKRVGGAFQPVMELSAPQRPAQGDIPQQIVGIVRQQRGALMISLDNGATYDVFWNFDGSPVYCPAGGYQWEGIGCCASLGLHQVAYYGGTYLSGRQGMVRSRFGAPNLSYYGSSAGVTVTNAAPVNSNYFQYQVQLTPKQIASHWTYYQSPEVQLVTASYPAQPSLSWPQHDGALTFEGRILDLTVEKPRELAGASCRWTCRYTPQEGGPRGAFGLRKVQVWGGWYMSDGTIQNYQPLFTGWITRVAVTKRDPGRVEVTFTAQDTSLQPRQMVYRPDNTRVFDGMVINSAFSQWAADMGLNDSYLGFHSLGSAVVLPQEFPEQPAFMGEAGQPRWEVMSKIAEYGRMELGVLSNGTFAMWQNNTWKPNPSVFQAVPINEQTRVEEVTYEQEVLEDYTGVLCRGHDRFGGELFEWLEDGIAEGDPLSDRFRPWPRWHVETLEHPVTPQFLNVATQGLAWDKMTPHFPTQWRGDLATVISRKDAVYLQGCADVGIGANLAQIGVETMRHVFNRREGNQAWTEIGGRRIG